MTNRTLIIIVFIIIILGVTAAWFFYWQQTKPLVVSSSSQTDQIQQMQNTPSVPQTASNTPVQPQQPAATSTEQAMKAPECVRSFDQNRLAANSNINIQNREVEIDVQNFGKIDLEFYPDDAPKAVTNFLRLVDAGYYDCLTFHRVAAGFVIQGGDPTGTGTGGQSAFGSAFEDELNPNSPSYKTGYVAGVLAMANAGPNTNGSQFFITAADDTSALQHLYTIFGHVVSGMNVVEAIDKVQTSPVGDGAPVTPVIMTSVKIIK